MYERWFYTNKGRTYGPVSIAQIKGLAAVGMLAPDDKVWPEGVDRKNAVEARAAIDFVGTGRASAKGTPPKPGDLAMAIPIAPASGPAPDWLGDVRKAEDTASHHEDAPEATPTGHALPDWVEDLRRLLERTP
jgi:hypothetical protein